MLKLMRAEWYKLTRGNALWLVLGGLAVLFTVLQAFPSGNTSWEGTPLTFSDGFVYGVGESTFAIVSGIIFLALSVGRDFGNGTLTHYVAAGHTRSRVVYGRFFSFLAGFLVICFVTPFLRGMLLGVLHGIGVPFAELGESTPLFAYAWRVFLLQLPFYFSLASLFYAGAVAAKGALGSLLVPGGLYMALKFLEGMGPFGEYLPIYQWELSAMPGLDWAVWRVGVAVAAGIAVLSLVSCWLLFRKTELR